jgi:hypothetical protein
VGLAIESHPTVVTIGVAATKDRLASFVYFNTNCLLRGCILSDAARLNIYFGLEAERMADRPNGHREIIQ